jgi:signal transduction histidine kinase
LKRRWLNKHLFGYLAILATATGIAVIAGFTGFASRIDNYAYDFLFGMYSREVWKPESLVLAIDEDTLKEYGGMARVRNIVADALEMIAPAGPRAVPIDIVLSDAGDPVDSTRLQAAMAKTRNLVLPCERVHNRWDDPLPAFAQHATGLGHIHADDQASRDGVSRQIPLEKVAPRERRWALSLVAFQHARGGGPILESPDDIEVAGVRVPAARDREDRLLRIRFPDYEPPLTVAALKRNPALREQVRDKTVFIGITALTAARDRLLTPRGESIPGVDVHRAAYETIAQGQFLVSASNLTILGVCLLLASGAGLTFWFGGGWWAYSTGAALLLAGHSLPALFFQSGVVFPYFASLSAAWLPVVGAATYQYFTVRRQLRESESDRARYRQAIHFVTHEMRTPLTAIQGSSELMGRYALPEEKRKQMAQMINSESKRLARMIQTFLDVERLTEGQMELKRDAFRTSDVVGTCIERVRPLAERKQIEIHSGALARDLLIGDRELMEYAVYNLLTNAVKYSPAGTEAYVSAERFGNEVRISVRDQGIGMDERELNNIFKKFYRTKRAEASGEVGTGIGLSIVEQIVTQHGGRIEVSSKPGQGSTFTITLPAHAEAPADVAPASNSR